MSASQEKKKRISDRSAEKEKLAAEQAAEAKKKSLKKVRNIVIAVVVVLVIAAIFVINSNLFYTGMTAVEINGTKYTAAETSYVYRTLYSNYLNQINSVAQQYGMDTTEYAAMMGLDTSKALDKQQYEFGEEGETWADYFRGQAIDSLKTMTMHADQAADGGHLVMDIPFGLRGFFIEAFPCLGGLFFSLGDAHHGAAQAGCRGIAGFHKAVKAVSALLELPGLPAVRLRRAFYLGGRGTLGLFPE